MLQLTQYRAVSSAHHSTSFRMNAIFALLSAVKCQRTGTLVRIDYAPPCSVERTCVSPTCQAQSSGSKQTPTPQDARPQEAAGQSE